MVCKDSFGLLAGGMCSEGSEAYGCGMRMESTLSRGGQGTAGDIRIGPSSIIAVYDGLSTGNPLQATLAGAPIPGRVHQLARGCLLVRNTSI